MGVVILATASLLGEAPGGGAGREAPTAQALEVPAGSQFDQSGVDQPVAPPREDAPVVAPDDAPSVAAPVTPVAPSLNPEITAPAAVPQTSGVGELGTPPAGASDSGVSLNAGGGASPTETGSAPSGTEAQESDAAPAADTEPAEEITLVTPDVVEGAEEEEAQAPTLSGGAVEGPEDEEGAESRPQASAGGFNNLAPNVTVNRPTEGTITDTDEEDVAPTGGALEVNALLGDWAGADDRPLVSIVILDEAGDASRLGAFQSFQGPLTFAVPASAPGASRAMTAYRDAGHEVVLVADLPTGATPADIEVAMQSFLSAVPEAVAVLDGTFDGFGGDRRAAEQVVEIVAETGHGLLTVSRGLNAAQQIAERRGVPSVSIFRDLDSEGQGNTAIRRLLDQAAFRAAQDGELVLLARTKAETISALLIWAQQDRAARVNLAPLSAVLVDPEATQ
ncbi:MAG: divergent polysaccharide deacetylase family protein [Pseudomonadota bacterium]